MEQVSYEQSHGSADDFAITLMVDPHQLTVRVQGVLDAETVPALRSALNDAGHGAAAMDIWVDFSDCHYLDAQTIALLAATSQKLRAANKQLSVEGLSDTQEAVARICGLNRIATIYS